MNFDKLYRAIKNPKYVYYYIKTHGQFRNISDEEYIKLFFKYLMGTELNLHNPQTYNEKLQWLKLYDRNPRYTQLVDKYEVREFVKNTIGDEYLIPLYGVYDSYEEIDFNELPKQFVLKPTHTSGNYFICKNKDKINHNKLKTEIDNWINREYFWEHREWPYKNVVPRIICEKLLVQEDNAELRDYRFFCFHGEPKFVTVDFSITDKDKTRRNLYSTEWELLNKEISYPKENRFKVNKPKNFNKMIELSKKLSKDIPHVRVDFYNISGKIYFGEMTFYHQSGYGDIRPEEFNIQMGNWLNLDRI